MKIQAMGEDGEWEEIDTTTSFEVEASLGTPVDLTGGTTWVETGYDRVAAELLMDDSMDAPTADDAEAWLREQAT